MSSIFHVRSNKKKGSQEEDSAHVLISDVMHLTKKVEYYIYNILDFCFVDHVKVTIYIYIYIKDIEYGFR
jgi:hypothetical protein